MQIFHTALVFAGLVATSYAQKYPDATVATCLETNAACLLFVPSGGATVEFCANDLKSCFASIPKAVLAVQDKYPDATLAACLEVDAACLLLVPNGGASLEFCANDF